MTRIVTAEEQQKTKVQMVLRGITIPKKIAEKLEKQVTNLFETRRDKKELETEEKSLVSEIKPLIIKYGDHIEQNYQEDSILHLGQWKIHNCAATRKTLDLAAGIVLMKKKINEAKNSNNIEELEKWQSLYAQFVILREDIDQDLFTRSQAILPKELTDAVIGESVSYKLLVYDQEKK